MLSDAGALAVRNLDLASNCIRHALMFFNSPDLDLQTAVPGTFSLTPSAGMIDDLRRDYQRMAGMILGDVPPFDKVIDSISELETQLNSRATT